MRNINKNRYNIKNNNFLLNHIKNNIKQYMVALILFFIGFVIGIIIVNKLGEQEKQIIQEYINSTFTLIKESTSINKHDIFIKSYIKNVILVTFIWLFGITPIGKYVIYAFVMVLGVLLGYTTSAIMIILNFYKGLVFFIGYILPSNIILIPTLLFAAIKGIVFYKQFIKERSYSYTFTFFRYSCSLFLITIVLLIPSIIEAYVSCNLLQNFIKYL